ncbi:MAG: hypothetical protein KC503_18190 [Myxococcales bacterium]|nr:hypothetical protein [Myxococcales bacterium]
MRPYLLLIAALGAMACNPSDPYCDPATPCVGDNEICNFALRRCEKKSDSGAPDGPIADVTPDTPKPDAPLPDAPRGGLAAAARAR